MVIVLLSTVLARVPIYKFIKSIIHSIVPILRCVLGSNLPPALCQVHKDLEKTPEIIVPKKQTTTLMRNHKSMYLTNFPPFPKKTSN